MQNKARLGLGRGCSWRDHGGGCEGDGRGGTLGPGAQDSWGRTSLAS